MNLRLILKAASGQLPVAAAAGLALVALAVLTDRGATGVVAAVGAAAAELAPPLITVVHGPRRPDAVNLPGCGRPSRLPTGRAVQAIAGALALIVVITLLTLPGWVSLLIMVIGGLALLADLAAADRSRRGRGARLQHIHRAVEAYAPRFLIYTGRRNDASYQLRMWIPVLERLGLAYLVVLRHPDALPSTLAATTAPVVVLPAGSDLDAVIVPGLRVAFYVNGVAENSTFVNYRSLIHVYLGHGDSDKLLSVHPMHGMFDRVFVAGQAAIDRYRQAGVIIPPEKFVIVGRPQTVGLACADRPIGQISGPTVLFAPTWRGYNAETTLSSLPVGPALVSALIRRGATVRFRPHPFSWLGAGERAGIAAVDEVLRRDRESTGRAHRLAGEGRADSLTDAFDASDALVTDVGSVLVDYFVTGKPYAVVLPPGQPAATAGADLPSTAAAYLVESDEISRRGADAVDPMLDDLLRTDPYRQRRAAVARHYLGDRPGDDQPFLDAVRQLIDPAS